MLLAQVLLAPVLEAPVHKILSCNAFSLFCRKFENVARAPVPEALVLEQRWSLELLAPVLQAMCYKHQRYSYSAISSVFYGVSDISHGHNSTVFHVLFPKISTGQKKLAPIGWHGWHVFATLIMSQFLYQVLVSTLGCQVGPMETTPKARKKGQPREMNLTAQCLICNGPAAAHQVSFFFI